MPATATPDTPPPLAVDMRAFPRALIPALQGAAGALFAGAQTFAPAMSRTCVDDAARAAVAHILAVLKPASALTPKVEQLGDQDLQALAAAAASAGAALTTLLLEATAELLCRHLDLPELHLVDDDGRPLIKVDRPAGAPAGADAQGRPLHLVKFDPIADGDLHRITCTTCDTVLGNMTTEAGELAAAAHIREVHQCLGEEVRWLHPDVPDPTGGPYDVPTCRRCGCTENQACVLLDKDQKTVIASCAWRELNPETNAGVCTACAE
jgi:hypothetical protein